MSVIIDLSIFPMDKTGVSLSPYVARVISRIRESGLPYRLGPMGTCVEGEWDELMRLVDACYKEVEKDADRIYMSIKIDAKKGRTGGLDGKVRSVETKL